MPSSGSVTSDQVAADGTVVVTFPGLELRGRVVVGCPPAEDPVGAEVVDDRAGGEALVFAPAHDEVTRATPIAIAHPRTLRRCIRRWLRP